MDRIAVTVHPAHRRRPSLLLLACLLLLATGVALVGAAATLSQPALPIPDHAPATNVALARRFYGAVATLLATGQTGDLAGLVSPALIDHPAAADGATGPAGLVGSLLALRAVFPGLGLAVDDLRATGNELVTARMHAKGERTGSFVGLPVPASLAALGPIEVLRVAGGRIAERWTGGADIGLQPVAREPLTVGAPPAPFGTVVLSRIAAEPGARFPVGIGYEERFLLVESGALTADPVAPPAATVAEGGASLAGDSSRSRRLAKGDLLAIAPGTAYTIANTTSDPAVAVAATILPPDFGDDGQGILPPPSAVLAGVGALPARVAVGVLATAVVPVGSPGATLGIGRLALAAGATLAVPPQTGAVLLAVEAGHLGLALGGGDGGGYRADGRPWSGAQAGLGVGDGAAVGAGTGALWQAGADGPAILLVVAVAVPDGGLLATPTGGTESPHAAPPDGPVVG